MGRYHLALIDVLHPRPHWSGTMRLVIDGTATLVTSAAADTDPLGVEFDSAPLDVAAVHALAAARRAVAVSFDGTAMAWAFPAASADRAIATLAAACPIER